MARGTWRRHQLSLSGGGVGGEAGLPQVPSVPKNHPSAASTLTHTMGRSASLGACLSDRAGESPQPLGFYRGS